MQPIDKLPDFGVKVTLIHVSALILAESGEGGNTETEKPAVSATETKNGRGQSVGVGASFAFVHGTSDITAGIGARTTAAGAVKAGAAADHVEKTTAVAGTDPLQTNGKASSTAADILPTRL